MDHLKANPCGKTPHSYTLKKFLGNSHNPKVSLHCTKLLEAEGGATGGHRQVQVQVQRRGVGGIGEVGAQVQDRSGERAGSRGRREEGQKKYDATGPAEGAAGGSTRVEGTRGTHRWRHRTARDIMREDTGERDTTG